MCFEQKQPHNRYRKACSHVTVTYTCYDVLLAMGRTYSLAAPQVSLRPAPSDNIFVGVQ